MKATYSKPLLTMEMFSMTQQVARDCAEAIPLTMADIATCAWDMDGVMVFTASNVCQLIGQPDDFMCYNNPSEGNYVFHS